MYGQALCPEAFVSVVGPVGRTNGTSLRMSAEEEMVTLVASDFPVTGQLKLGLGD